MLPCGSCKHVGFPVGSSVDSLGVGGGVGARVVQLTVLGVGLLVEVGVGFLVGFGVGSGVGSSVGLGVGLGVGLVAHGRYPC